MKKILFSLAALIGMGCFSACSNDDEAVVQDSRKGVTIRAAIAGDADARVALGDSEGGKTKVMWSLNDAFTLAVGTESYTFTTTGEGTEAEFTSTDCPQTFTTSGTITASYPANTVNYALQDGSKEKVGNYMTMTATCDVSAGDNAEDLNLSFKHHTSVVEVSLTNTDFASKAVTVILSATNLLENGSDITTTNSELKGDANGKVVAYLVVPATATGKTLVDFKITAICENVSYEATFAATKLDAGKLYTVEKEVSANTETPYVRFSSTEMQRLYVKIRGSYALDPSLQYSVDDGQNWNQLTAGNYISFGGDNLGDLLLRGKSCGGTAASGNQDNAAQISFDYDHPVACSGDIRTLVDWENYATVSTLNARFRSLFSGCSQLTSAPELPITELADYCYAYMFEYCTNLTIAPVLPATVMKTSCYFNMFFGCSNLNEATILATTTNTFGLMGWLNNVSSSGTLYVAQGMKNSISAPAGWTVLEITNP